jgi:5-methylcytosine-specific restriction endonuclease McrA
MTNRKLKPFTCRRCTVEKPSVDFYNNKVGSTNHTTYGAVGPYCKECERSRLRGKVRTEADKAREKAYKSTPEYKARRSELRNAAWAAMSPEEHAAAKQKLMDSHFKHHEKRLEAMRKKYREDPVHRESISEAQRRARSTPEGRARHNELNRLHSKTPKGRQSSVNNRARRRVRLRATKSTLTVKEWRTILERWNHHCAYCGSETKLEQEHVVAISNGGTHTADNVVPACLPCNRKKATHPVSRRWLIHHQSKLVG